MKKCRIKDKKLGCLLLIIIIVWAVIIFYGIRLTSSLDIRDAFATHRELFVEMAEYQQRREYAYIRMGYGKVSMLGSTEEYEIELFKNLYHRCGVDVVYRDETTVQFKSFKWNTYQYLVYSNQSLDINSVGGNWNIRCFEELDENWFYYEFIQPNN